MKNGRTFWDLLSEQFDSILLAFFVVLALATLALIIIFG